MIEHLKSPHLSCPHGFLTFKRVNAGKQKSSGLFAFSEFDSDSQIMRNKKLVSDSLKLKKNVKILMIRQVHSNKVLVLDNLANTVMPDKNYEGDAIVTKIPNLAISIVTADCAPILFLEPVEKIIGCAHAGWRGALAGITDNVVNEMVRLGANIDRITAIIGPCISAKNYEVREDFREIFMKKDESCTELFTKKEDGKYTFDLPGYIVNRLKNVGIKNTHWINLCTYARPDLFHSHRRSCHNSEASFKRNISIISLPQN